MNYIEKNKSAWNLKTDLHTKSEFYDVPGFINGKSSLNPIELDLLKDVQGKDVLHLQCHFGMDTLTLARMGAKATGVDLSDKSINYARDLNNQLGLDAEFICSNVYDLNDDVLDKKFDIVFSSYGAIPWLEDLDKWAEIISHYLKPGGIFVFAEFHPVVWMFDDNFTHLAYNYFKEEAIIEFEESSYANPDDTYSEKVETISWNHSLSEVITSLLGSGLTLTHFGEYDYSPYKCFRHMAEVEEGKYHIQPLGRNCPIAYSIIAKKLPIPW